MTELTNYIVRNKILMSMLGMYLLNPFYLGHYFGYILVVIVLLNKKQLLKNLDSTFVILLLFSIVYAIFYSFDMTSGVQYIFIYSLLPSIFYLLGKHIATSLKKNSAPYFLCICAFVFSLSALVSVLSNILSGGFVQIDRSLPMIWNGNLVSATVMGSFFTLNMCIPAILISRPKQFNSISKIVLIIIFIATMLATLRLGSRTQIVIFIMTSIISLFYIFPKQSAKKNFTIIFSLLISTFLIIRKFSFDLNSDLLTAFAGRMQDSNNNVANAGNRSDRWAKSFEYLFSHPLGWDVHEFGHSHNLWLDTLRTSGVIAFILLIILFIKSTLILKRKLTSGNLPLPVKVQYLVYFGGFILIFMVEPILDGMTSLFVLFCLFIGVIQNTFYDKGEVVKNIL